MALRFFKRVKIAPGVTLNFSKSGASLSLGPRGAKFTLGPRGKRVTAGLPGTGIFYTTNFPKQKAKTSPKQKAKTFPKEKAKTSPKEKAKAVETPSYSQSPAVPIVRPKDRLTMGFFKRLITPSGEEALVDGSRECALSSGDKSYDKALQYFKKASHLADGAYLAGILSLKRQNLYDAGIYLRTAVHKHKDLGKHFSKYGISATVSLSITNEVSAHVGPNIRGALLGLVEVCQLQKNWQEAIECLKKLRQLDPNDVVVKLSIVELVIDKNPNNKETYQKILKLTHNIKNESPIHTNLMLYRAQALRKLGLFMAARDILSLSLRRKTDRSKQLLLALRYERALVYEQLGKKTSYLEELRRIYRENSKYEDVADRLELEKHKVNKKR